MYLTPCAPWSLLTPTTPLRAAPPPGPAAAPSGLAPLPQGTVYYTPDMHAANIARLVQCVACKTYAHGLRVLSLAGRACAALSRPVTSGVTLPTTYGMRLSRAGTRSARERSSANDVLFAGAV